MKFEQDLISLSSGIRFGQSQGGPIAIRIANTEWPKVGNGDERRPSRCRAAKCEDAQHR